MTTTLKNYVLFRVKQFYRILQEIGIGHLIILAPLLFMAVLGVLQFVSTSKNCAAGVLLLLSLVSVHWSRKDRFFLEQVSCPLFLFYLLDYLLISSPLIGCFIFWSKWINLLIISLGVIILPLIKPRYNQQNQAQLLNWFNVRWIPLFLFEWRCGLRKNMLAFLLVYLLGLGFSYYAVAVPITLILMALGVTTFFQYFENKDLLLAVNKDQQLLVKKSFGSLKLFNLLILPHTVLFLIFHHTYQHIGALLIVYLIAQAIIVFAICMKYKNYRFNHYKVYNSMPLSIFVGCWCVPFLWPIPVLMLVQFWKSAQENLSYHYC